MIFKTGFEFIKKNWEGYMVNTIFTNEIECTVYKKNKSDIVCKKDKSDDTHTNFTVEPKESLVRLYLNS